MRLSLPVLIALTCGFAHAAPAGEPDYTPVDKRDSLNLFLAAITETFPVNVAVTEICGALTVGEEALAETFGLSTTENANGCADVTLVFARGTCDPGNLGALSGPSFVTAVKKAVGSSKSVAVQGIDYPATVDGYLTADPAAGRTMAKFISTTLASCPKTKFVLGGYSQGGYAVHNAAKDLDANALSKVAAVVIFGDPMSKQPVQGVDPGRVKIVCHKGDNICDAGPIITISHLTYAADASAAASFVVSKL
ncbi:hypothetical protein QQS21_009219 [Conoideocrella luteorostrata]|uniref:cutinase n=1 Tax=Conoideocrella luteorostrata TaxID=1105319 RepID=A0AAJ0CK28_9HYPO|nr:hypothetical protein QQS21_009219 [Conoideocrella luteorostrata]